MTKFDSKVTMNLLILEQVIFNRPASPLFVSLKFLWL